MYTTTQTKAMICAAVGGDIIPLLLATGHAPVMGVLEVEVVGVETLVAHQPLGLVAVAMALFLFNTCLGNRRKL